MKYKVNSLLAIPQLPVWQGVEEFPGNYKTCPFAVGWDSRGFLKQHAADEILGELSTPYGMESYKHMTLPPGHSHWANSRGDAYLEVIRRNCKFLKNSSAIEVGSGSLYVAEKLVSENDVGHYVAIDPALTEVSQDPKISSLREYFSHERFDRSVYDYVFSFHCLEHVSDPLAFLVELRYVLQDAGVMVLSFPDAENYIYNGDLNGFIHEHISYLTDESARRLFAYAGLRVIDFIREGGSLTYALEKSQSAPIAEYPPSSLVPSLQERVESSVEQVRSLILSKKSRGRVALHGATSGLNSFLFLAFAKTDSEWWRDLLVFDGDMSKSGKYLPVLPVAIRHVSDTIYKSVDTVLICAQSFSEAIRNDIIKQHNICNTKIELLIGGSFRDNDDSGV
jgi:SAM-dependent methyltransferase